MYKKRTQYQLHDWYKKSKLNLEKCFKISNWVKHYFRIKKKVAGSVVCADNLNDEKDCKPPF